MLLQKAAEWAFVCAEDFSAMINDGLRVVAAIAVFPFLLYELRARAQRNQ